MKWSRWFLLVLATWGAALCMMGPAASARSTPRLLASSPAPLRTDGWRYALYSAPSGVVRLFDTRRGSSRSVSLPAGCTVADGHRGFFLANCPNESAFSVPHVLAARTGHLIAVPGLGRTYFPNADDFSQLGTRWLQGITAGEGHPTTEYLNWRTGKVRDFGEGSGDPSVPRDLDTPGLSPIGPSGFFFVYLRRGPLTVFSRLTIGQAPLLFKPSNGTTVRLDRCDQGCSSVALGARLITWASGTTARAYDPRTHARFAWHFASPLGTQDYPDSGVQQTAQRLYFNVSAAPSVQAAFRIYSVRAPH